MSTTCPTRRSSHATILAPAVSRFRARPIPTLFQPLPAILGEAHRVQAARKSAANPVQPRRQFRPHRPCPRPGYRGTPSAAAGRPSPHGACMMRSAPRLGCANLWRPLRRLGAVRFGRGYQAKGVTRFRSHAAMRSAAVRPADPQRWCRRMSPRYGSQSRSAAMPPAGGSFCIPHRISESKALQVSKAGGVSKVGTLSASMALGLPLAEAYATGGVVLRSIL